MRVDGITARLRRFVVWSAAIRLLLFSRASDAVAYVGQTLLNTSLSEWISSLADGLAMSAEPTAFTTNAAMGRAFGDPCALPPMDELLRWEARRIH
jgi:hypothetical protein